MAFAGYLIKLGGPTGPVLPLSYMTAASYNVEPNQRLVGNSAQAVTGQTHRTILAHTPTKIEFEAPKMKNDQLVAFNTLLSANMSDTRRKDITIYYYDMDTDSYRTANCYMPDIKHTIQRIDGNTIYYKPFKVAFIEY